MVTVEFRQWACDLIPADQYLPVVKSMQVVTRILFRPLVTCRGNRKQYRNKS